MPGLGTVAFNIMCQLIIPAFPAIAVTIKAAQKRFFIIFLYKIYLTNSNLKKKL